ncbi:MAG: polysaccharide deacetylase [Clostridia bacterium]|nr:polysaccharide deacetylase [Clostridia bacterium]
MKRIIFLLICSITILSVAVFASTDSEKTVYITFDDGPTHNTPVILDTLKKYNAKATFFVLNDRITENPDLLRRIIAEGHSIGLHGSSHDVNVIYSTPSKPLEEMNKANENLYNTVGFKTRLIRTPYGSYPYMNLEQYKILKAANYNLWDWTVDPRDGVGTPTIDTMLNRITNDLKGNENPIVLLHDRKSTANNLDSILNYFSSRNYTFDVLTEKTDPVNFMELYGPARNKSG